MLLSEAFSFLKEPGHIVCLVGGGGKTSLMYALAGAGAAQGMKVVVTTTTHIMVPENIPVVQHVRDLIRAFEHAPIVCVGSHTEGRRLRLPDSISLRDIMRTADLILIEADGAKQLPCKVPASHEPVIPDECDIVIGVMGMDTPGRPLGEICFRRDETAAFLGVDPQHVMTTCDMQRILCSERGTMKDVGKREYDILLNKCDTPDRKELAEKLRRLLLEAGRTQVFCSALQTSDEVW